MHRVTFPVHQFRGKQRVGKLLGKAVQCRFQEFSFHVEEVVGVCEGGEGVVTAAVAADELLVFARVRIFFGTQKQHVLQKMGETLTVFRIVAAAHRYIHGGGRFISGRV